MIKTRENSMCIRNAMPVRLSGPKKVYKVFIIAIDAEGNETIHSPYNVLQKWTCGKLHSEMNSDREVRDELRRHYKDWSMVNELHGGVFHSLENREDAETLLDIFKDIVKEVPCYNLVSCAASKFAIGECTIPPDSEYVFEGTFEVIKECSPLEVIGMESLASSDLTLDRILE